MSEISRHPAQPDHQHQPKRNQRIQLLLLVNFFIFKHFWNAGKLSQSLFITKSDEDQERDFRNSESDVYSSENQEPSEYISDDKTKRNNKMEFYWRKVACLGKRGEVIKTVCCTDNHPKPWAILLPTKHKVKCSKPNCKSTCYSEIIKIREKKFFNQQPQSHLIDERDKKNKLFSKKSRDCSKGVSFNSHTVPIPEIILELIDLCNFLNNSNILQFEKLNSFCKMKNMNLDDFLNHVNYKGRTSYGLDESNFKRQKDGDENFENKSYDEIALEMKDTNLIQPILENYLTSENYFETTNKIKNIPKSGRKRTYVATTNAIYNHQSTFKDNESNKFPILELNSIMNGLFPLKYEFLNIHLMHTTGKTSTSYYCDNYCDEEDIFETTTSSATSTDTTATTTSTDTTTASTATASTTIATTATASTTTASTTTATTATASTTTASTTSSTTIATKKICVEIEETNNNCCCNCKKNRKTHNKKKLSNLLFAFLRGPRPTFANHDAMHSTTFTIAKHCQTMLPNIANKMTIPMTLSSSTPSYTVLKAEKPYKLATKIRIYGQKESVKHYIDYIDDMCANMYKVYKQKEWEYETNITYDTRQSAMASSLEFNQLSREAKRDLARFVKEPMNDCSLQRQIKLLSLPGMDSLSEMKSNEFKQILYAMETIYSSATVDKYNHENEKVVLSPDIVNIMAQSVDPNELQYYWVEWRRATGKHIRPLFDHYVSLMCLAAKKNGFHDASEMWTRYYETEDFIDILGIYWEGIKPLYLQLQAYVRYKLHCLYGDVAVAKEVGKIPAHLTGDIWGKNWKNLYYKVKPYDLEEYMVQPLKKTMTPQKITRVIEDMFVSMGFTKLPNEFWNNSIFTKPSNRLILCEPSAWDMGDGKDFRIKMCANCKMEDLFNIHHLVTVTEYYKEYRELPYAFRNAANPGFAEAIGETMVLSADTEEHLRLFGINIKQSENIEINKLMRIALEKVAFIPYSYILVLWRHKVFTGEINVTNYNSEWWKLRSEYQGLYPPIKRTEEDFDVGCKQHIVANQPYLKYFLSTILQFQFYQALCKHTGFEGPLHRCVLKDSARAGQILRKAMSMGSSHHWKDALEALTGTRKIDSRSLMNYFAPLMKWLQTHNRQKHLKLGWDE